MHQGNSQTFYTDLSEGKQGTVTQIKLFYLNILHGASLVLILVTMPMVR